MRSISLPRQFWAAGVRSGISSQKDKLDLALFYSFQICQTAAIFTRNRVQAAPVRLSREVQKSGVAQAILANSGCANACTGDPGIKDALQSQSLLAHALSIPKETIFVASTGVIGSYLPMNKLKKGVKQLISLLQKYPISNGTLTDSAVRAIMTTDTVPKTSCVTLTINGGKGSIWACAKGSGMIHPDMATMLCFILTDFWVSSSSLQSILKTVCDTTFNSLSVDGDTSTNDSVFLLANGASGTELRNIQDLKNFETGVEEVCRSLAYQMVADGEGATRVMKIQVVGSRSVPEAKVVAQTVATSPLVKTALFGSDANWGRIMAAIGRSGVAIDPDRIDLSIGEIPVAKNGSTVKFSETRVKKFFNQKIVPWTINLNQGKSQYEFLTCDLSLDYVKINADYRS